MDIQIKPSAVFAFLKTVPFILCATAFMYLANRYFAGLIWLALICIFFAFYHFLYIRSVLYLVTDQYIRISQGLFFKRITTIELFRVKDYIITEPFLLQVLKLMDVHLKTTDPENPELWLRGIPQSDIIDIIRERVLETRQHNRIYEIN
jgi:uncharacterized membrane protein YdbT with pleckstrin-like domain